MPGNDHRDLNKVRFDEVGDERGGEGAGGGEGRSLGVDSVDTASSFPKLIRSVVAVTGDSGSLGM